ncbi:uncharacterized protein EV154DRAFT_556870 [Mucor mucedo]|uniref:uncharacterized protein n=1 Tax=Mucor mucedo TaxID=29922 RepID=UPI0022209874|nr:uncharacterized protein EV154DRAFT_556870 [Mucor mucedo]KAI7868198.1 hypothetical protein EV154DRAFT_556870 [Mucor mucedo]
MNTSVDMEEEKRRLLTQIEDYFNDITQSIVSVGGLWDVIMEYRNTSTDALATKSLQEWNTWDHSVYKCWKNMLDLCKEVVRIFCLTLEELSIAKKTGKLHSQVIREIRLLTKTFEKTFNRYKNKSTGSMEVVKRIQYTEDPSLNTSTIHNQTIFKGLLCGFALIHLGPIALGRKTLIIVGTIIAATNIFNVSFLRKKKKCGDINVILNKLTEETILMNHKLKKLGSFVINKTYSLKIDHSANLDRDSIQTQIVTLSNTTKELKDRFEFLLNAIQENLVKTKEVILQNNPIALLNDD